MSINGKNWSETVSVSLVYLQEILDELLLLQMNEGCLQDFFRQMYFDISRKDETAETKALLDKIEQFRIKYRGIFLSTLEFQIAPLHGYITILNRIVDDPSAESKEQLETAINTFIRYESFVLHVYQDEFEVISEYLKFKEKQLQIFKDEKHRLATLMSKTNSDRNKRLRSALDKLQI
ncbi:MAG: hypothetical protein FK734_18560 [Asgard group archaeon]|nr:hypothetical protein [Asgard group archaeon]